MAFLSLPNWEIILKRLLFSKRSILPTLKWETSNICGSKWGQRKLFSRYFLSPRDLKVMVTGHKTTRTHTVLSAKRQFFLQLPPVSLVKNRVGLDGMSLLNILVPALYLYLFIYLFIAVLGLCCCSWVFPNCCSQVVVRGLLFAVASLVEHRFQRVWASVLVAHGLSSSGAWG